MSSFESYKLNSNGVLERFYQVVAELVLHLEFQLSFDTLMGANAVTPFVMPPIAHLCRGSVASLFTFQPVGSSAGDSEKQTNQGYSD